MSSVRQNILNLMGEKLPLISTANGYSNTVRIENIYKGFKSLNQINTFPSLFYGLGSESLQSESEDNNTLMQKCEAYIGIYFKSEDLSAEYEEWIRDLKRFIMCDRTLTDNMYLDFNEVNYVQSWLINDIQPYMDYDKKIGSLLITFEIDYIESVRGGL